MASIEGDAVYKFLLYYQYVDIEDVEAVCREQLELCRNLRLNGRIRVAREGINGTLGGGESAIHQYVSHMNDNHELSAVPIHWKISDLLPGKDPDVQKFKSLSVKSTKEVVSLDLMDEDKSLLLSGEIVFDVIY